MPITRRREIPPIERWATFPEIAPYEVSDQGRVRSPSRLVPYKSTGLQMRLPERILKAQPMAKGHLQVTLPLPGGKKTFFVHRIVLTAFAGPSELGTRHFNDTPTDNRLVNLAWGTQFENMQDRTYLRGAEHYSAKLTLDQELQIVQHIREGRYSQRALGRMFGVSNHTIARIRDTHS